MKTIKLLMLPILIAFMVACNNGSTGNTTKVFNSTSSQDAEEILEAEDNTTSSSNKKTNENESLLAFIFDAAPYTVYDIILYDYNTDAMCISNKDIHKGTFKARKEYTDEIYTGTWKHGRGTGFYTVLTINGKTYWLCRDGYSGYAYGSKDDAEAELESDRFGRLHDFADGDVARARAKKWGL